MTYQRSSLAVDMALMTVSDGALKCLMMRRQDAQEVGGDWALPGGYVRIDEAIDQAAQRVLADKVGVRSAYLEQLFTYGAVDRDPRERVVSVAHFALMPARELLLAVDGSEVLTLARVETAWLGETGGAAQALNANGQTLRLAFDHALILGDVIKRLRGKLDYTSIVLELLPDAFTLRQVQEIYEAILGQSLTKPAFRRKFLHRNIIQATGRREEASAFRPAELYTRL